METFTKYHLKPLRRNLTQKIFLRVFLLKINKKTGFSSKKHKDSREMDLTQLCAIVRNFAFWRKSWRFHQLLDSTTMMRVKYQK
jgi:hypothetical protein